MDCIGDQELHALCQGELQLDTLDISGSFVTSQWYVITCTCCAIIAVS